MARKFLDGLAEYSDPASSGLKVMDGGGTWEPPDAGRKAYDAAGEWTAPELKVPHHVTVDRSHDINQHILINYIDGKEDFFAGELVSLEVPKSYSSASGDGVGWLPSSQPYVESQLNDRHYGTGYTYTFTMPDEGVTVYGICRGGPHRSQAVE